MIEFYTVGFGEQKEATLDVLGGKGYNLVKMANAGVNVPPAVIIPTTYCNDINSKTISAMEIATTVYTQLVEIEKFTGYMPLFSVRSGAKVSLPGMMETILNVGLCVSTIPAWEKRIGIRATWDSYRRLIQMFGDVVFSIPSEKYEAILTAFRNGENVATDAELSVNALQVIATRFLEITPEFPQSFKMQLRKAIAAVFNSWNNERAITYRNIHKISHDIGTAVIVQSMVFGNLNDNSCTGVLFTRNPSTGENKIHGEYLVNAQGEDVVAGIRTPLPLEHMDTWNPALLTELVTTVNKLELSNRDMQDIEFTVQDGKLYILQTRNAKRTAIAAVKIATDLVVSGVIEKSEAFKRISYEQYCIAQKPVIDPEFSVKPNGVGIPASSGFATGVVAFSSEKAVELAKTMPVILLAKETTPEDISGMNAALGILTQTGGGSCFTGETGIVTDKGIINAKDLNARFNAGESFKLASYTDNATPVWRNLIGVKKEVSAVKSVSFGKAGRATQNVIKVTADHEFIIRENGSFGKLAVADFKEKASVLVGKELPSSITALSDKPTEFFWVLGALFTDGYIKVNSRRGVVVFSQKKEGVKIELIERVSKAIKVFFNADCKERVRKENSIGILADGREIKSSGDHITLTFCSKDWAEYLFNIRANLSALMLGASKEQALAFLAGVADGDGASNVNRLHLYISRTDLKQGILVAASKADVRVSSIPNRTISNIQVSYGANEVCNYSTRHNVEIGKFHSRVYRATEFEPSFFSLTDHVLRNRYNEAVKRDILVDGTKMGKTIAVESSWAFVEDCIDAPQDVFDFTVESETEIGHSYLVVSTGGNFVWVSNCHAAVVARGMDKVCVVGCLDLTPSLINIDGTVQAWSLGGATIIEGVTSITIEGNTGNVWVEVSVPVIGAANNPAVALLNEWVGEVVNYTEKVTGGASGYLLTHQFDTDMLAFKNVLANFKGIVSLNTGKDMISPWDAHLFELVTPFDDTEVKQSKLEAMLEVPVKGVSIDIDNFKLPVSIKNKLAKQGYEIIPTISDLEGVVMSAGVVKFASDFKFTPAVNEVIGMKKQLGKSYQSLMIIDEFNPAKDYGNAHIVAAKDVVLKTLLK